MQEQTAAVTTFTVFDWFLVALLVISTAAAFHKGIVRVLLSLAGLVAALLIASWNYVAVAESLHRSIASFLVCETIAFVVLFVLVTMLFSFVARAASKALRAVGLGFVDRFLGAAFGLVRGLLLGVAAMMVTSAFYPDAPGLENSVLTPYFLSGLHAVSFVVPAHFQDEILLGARRVLHETPGLLQFDRSDRHRHSELQQIPKGRP